MSQIERLLKKNRRLRSVPDSFIKKLSVVEKNQFFLIAEKMRSFQTKGVSITISKANLLIIDDLKAELRADLLAGDYKTIVKEFIKEFDGQKKINEEYYSDVSKNPFSTEVADQLVKTIKTQTVEALMHDTIEKDYLRPLETILNNSVGTGAGFDETLRRINTFIEGEQDADGRLQQYAKQLAHDSFANSDRAFGSAVADELQLDFFLYAGDEIATTRCFCLSRHGKFYHRKEIAAWGRGEDVGDCGFPWKGMNEATDENTIFNYAGGYNCMHTIAGVSIFDTPTDDIQRNISNGNYEPSKYETENLDL